MQSLLVPRRLALLAAMAVLAIVGSASAVTIGAPRAPAAPAAPAAAVAQTGPCVLQPTAGKDLFEMSTIVENGLFKTVAMEKEIYKCTNAAMVNEIKDLETFIEIIQTGTLNATGALASNIVDVRVRQVTCAKNFTTGQISCGRGSITLATGTAATPPLQGCDWQSGDAYAPTVPTILNMVVNGGVVKEIKVDKEVFMCHPVTGAVAVLRDVYVFTEILEYRQNATTTTPPLPLTYKLSTYKFIGVTCDKQLEEAKITGCARFTPLSITNTGS